LLFLMKGPVKNEGGDPVDIVEISYPVRHIRAHVHSYSQHTETVFFNFYGAWKSIPRNRFRQPL
jgi:hypothetical protein